MSQQAKPQLTSDDADKLGLPTTLDDIFSFGEEGKTINDVIGLIIGANRKDLLAIMLRTNLSPKEASIIADTLFVAHYPLVWTPQWIHKIKNGEWFIPELLDYVVNLLSARVSIDGKSLHLVVEALQAIKIKVESQKQTLLSQQ